MRNGAGARVPAEYTLAAEEFLAIGALGGRGRDSVIQLAAPIAREDIERIFRDRIETTIDVEWISDRRAVRSTRRTSLGAVVIAESVEPQAARERLVRAIVHGVRSDGIDALPWTDAARSARERLRFLHGVDSAWPDVSDDALLETLDEWLAPYLGAPGTAGLEKLDLGAVLLTLLDHRQRARFDEMAPTHIQVPSGSRIRVDYSDPESPALPVRLQEIFGLNDTPTLAGGRIPLTMRLLSPAMRPVQVTRDLASFWREGYFEVRRDLRGRYPKHYWPENPLEAQATRRTRPR
jgi:ATP-dependent helicase HrpB